MNHNQRAALANPNLEFGASTFLGIPVGPKQMMLVWRDKTGEGISFPLKALLYCPDGTAFPSDWTQGMSEIETVVLPSNIATLSIPDETFNGDNNLENIIGIEKLEKIPKKFCMECYRLKVSRLDALVINESAFFACYDLERVELPNVTDVRLGAFEACDKATIVLNDNVTSVADRAFIGIGNLIYHGSLPGAPWGAQKWNGVPQS